MNNILTLLKHEPFSVKQTEKEKIFLDHIKEAAKWHYENNKQFRNLCENRSFDPSGNFTLADMPYFPVTLF